MKTWTEKVWTKSENIYTDILSLPFIKELSAGTLPTDKFARYIAQDELYLGGYGRQMFSLAELLKDPADREFFSEFARAGLEGEKAMHALLIEQFGIDTAASPSIVTSGYNSHSDKAISTGSPALGLAALLPCAWIYNRVGLDILRTSSLESNPYREWILEYGNEEFCEQTKSLLEMTDRIASEASSEERDEMDRIYLEGAIYEYAFWDYGYRGEEGSYEYLENPPKRWI